MSDHHPEQPPEQPDEQDVPASVTFMEMMRQAASRSAPGEPSDAEPVLVEPPPEAPPPDLQTAVDQARRRKYDAALEAQRIQRVQRRRKRRRRQTVSLLGGVVRSFLVVFAAAGLMATIFTWFTPTQFIDDDVRSSLSLVQVTAVPTVLPTPQPTPNWARRIGIVSGHRGPEMDPGAVCPDGLTETEINFNIAQRVVANLRDRGYMVDLLDEFDPRLDNYEAAALVSIHANSCTDYGEFVSGYLISAAAARVTARGPDNVLVECIARHYQAATNLQRRDGLTDDMTNYHTFREIHARTPAVILELGFMLADRALLTEQPDLLAQGITDGVLCFLDPTNAPPVEAVAEAGT